MWFKPLWMLLVPFTQTSLKQNEGIEVIWRHYEDHYEHNLPIPTNDLRSFKFNERYFTQTHGVAVTVCVMYGFQDTIKYRKHMGWSLGLEMC